MVRMNENGNEKCSLLLLLVFGACFHLPFDAFCCSSFFFLRDRINSVSKTKAGKFPFAACYGFLLLVSVFCGCFHLSIALLVGAFCWYEKSKRETKGKKGQNGNQDLLS